MVVGFEEVGGGGLVEVVGGEVLTPGEGVGFFFHC